ncbi:MAG: 2-alkenal reductase [Candidatus Eremiobacteraeota bacterium]|nr:2-alkenal reductase [Candidatus Eremiobacteraeota bacterium]
MKTRLRMLIAAAVIGSLSMTLGACSNFSSVTDNTPAAVSAAPITSGTTDQDRITNAVKSVEPSVVALQVTVNGTVVVPVDPLAQALTGAPPYARKKVVERASGSGFIYSRDGLIVTNAHVVPHGTTKITVIMANNDRVNGRLYSSNPGIDLALVKVDNYAKLPPPVAFADSTKLKAGQWAIAIGEPLALQQSVTVGVVSGFNRNEPIQGDDQQVHLFRGLLQTSAPINPGNSGGPLIDYEGRVVGVNQSTADPSSAQGIGFAIPSNTVLQTAQALAKSPGKTINTGATGTGKGFLGVSVVAIDQNVRAQLGGYTDPGGVAIAAVPDGTPAAAAGLEPGDVIEAVNGKPVSSPEQFVSTISAMKPAAKVTLRVWQRGIKRNVQVTLAEQPAELYLQQQQQQP